MRVDRDSEGAKGVAGGAQCKFWETGQSHLPLLDSKLLRKSPIGWFKYSIPKTFS